MQQNKYISLKNTDQDQQKYLSYFEVEDSKWESLQKAKYPTDIAIYATPFEDSGLNILKVQYTMPNTTLSNVTKIFGKIQHELAQQEKEYKILEESENKQVIFQLISPPIVTDRELLLQLTTHHISDTESQVFVQSIEHSQFPLNSKNIRAEQFRFMNLKQLGNDVVLNSIAYIDMKGSIPKMIFNKVIASKISSQIKIQHDLVKQLEKKK